MSRFTSPGVKVYCSSTAGMLSPPQRIGAIDCCHRELPCRRPAAENSSRPPELQGKQGEQLVDLLSSQLAGTGDPPPESNGVAGARWTKLEQ